ncbi:nucleotide-binding universal stress UspA family protein [Halopolyspora algeriensis]|uniref:Nucleotide-binding universal stress UspA family protein n=1 Tax=Halopolyspora algeriensis TaxID=1500506 RepID=A0A368W009_9ACTN|nr:universal stress protein [Halopolyspora algeriensis]RCW45921.1 nucleotide-binding universal stress UspA family protein [Halopolyspora algeriensis]TQM55334.1 nucleotide-binding universal stress UspA family protein [Halopolyspora algeriensis]
MSEQEQRIVVGIDGSAGSRAALRWALRYADKTGEEVTALIAWAHPTYYGVGAPMPEEDPDKDAERALRKAVEETTSLLGSQVSVRQEVVRGHPAETLVNAVRSNDLLVVGSRGHGGFVGVLLGSVSQHCVHHSPCPVLVVRHEEEPEGGPA